MKIYNLSYELIFENDSTTMKETVEAAVAAGISLYDANLEGANLYGANLCSAILRGAILPEGVPVIPNIHQAVYEAASQPDALDMDL